MFQTEIVEEIKNLHFVFYNFFFKKNHAVYDVMWKIIVQPDRLQMTI